MIKAASLYVISGPSGVGKGTVCKALLAGADDLVLSVSATTRKPRAGEVHGTHYYFLTKEDFEAKISRGEFLEWAKVYENYYGTLRAFVEEKLAAGQNVLLEIDTNGALQVKKLLPSAVLVFLAPPSEAELLRRLEERQTDSPAEIAKRQQCLAYELSQQAYYDHIVINDDLSRTVAEIRQIIAGSPAAQAAEV